MEEEQGFASEAIRLGNKTTQIDFCKQYNITIYIYIHTFHLLLCIQDVKTRWGSTQAMIARILEQQEAICRVLAEDRGHWHCMPSPHDFTTLEAVSSVLQPLQVFTDALSGEKNVIVSAIHPLLKHTRYTNEEMMALIDNSTFLDARFKVCHLDSKEATIAR